MHDPHSLDADGCTYREVAREVGCSVGTVSRHVGWRAEREQRRTARLAAEQTSPRQDATVDGVHTSTSSVQVTKQRQGDAKMP
jgi:hypothetical protein